MKTKDLAIMGAVIVAAAAVLVLKQVRQAAPAEKGAVPAASVQAKALPRLVDLGAGKCIPCKAMKPVLEDLEANYAASFKTEFIDVWQNPDAGKQYNINLIPTQIFFGTDGKELFRHEGFFAKEDILAKWKELGVETAEKNAQRPTPNAQR